MSQEIQCPSCGGSQFEVVSPGRLRCVSETITAAVPPGQGGNLGSATIPLYGPCGTVFTEQDSRQAAASEEQRRAERQRQQDQEARWAAEEADLLARKTAALAKLNELGNPGAVPRRVPGRYYLSLSRRLLQQVGEVMPVEAEPAWPVGTCKWHRRGKHGEDRKEKLLTGITPTGRLVPMEHGTQGDKNVEGLYHWWLPSSKRPPLRDIVIALEDCLPSAP